ncbi:transglutaminase-like domain-containing protein [Paenibacillus faecalis]|uniref:transglutaminase-like domain-containing protein n=1 Tax=Paenibacillus faecalis TaxID=2079532 RepID=UPI000D0FFAD8|nr:transglutaminase-like domain-containing protein [Paenibacillus faecalis]
MTQVSVFSLSPQTMEQIDRKFRKKQDLASARRHELFDIFQEELSLEEIWALKYLYAYMPINDMADYDGALFLSHVRQSLEIRKQMPWGSRVPDHLFLHFVLPYRVNTENIEDFRGILYNELFERTQNLSMADAILETNYWCHEKATYIASDQRTISPLTMIRNARGRCGEESTLAVAALRSIGIPARQVYTPRWAHTDSNHAWVEAWADGQWYYFGACEPEARLNQGWFSPPARRAMLINTRIFADYPGPEDITLASGWFTEINLLPNYAPARIIHVFVKDEQGTPVSGADVYFELYNMGELYPIAALPTDDQGKASFKTGFGELVIRAVKDGKWKEMKVAAHENDLELVLDASEQPDGTWDFDLIPPPERSGEAAEALSEEQIQHHHSRLEEGTKIRTDYENTFLKEEDAFKLAQTAGLSPERVWEVLQKARGNSREIAAFLEERSEEYGEWPLRLLESLHDKDLIDTFRETLDDHLMYALRQRGDFSEDTFIKYVLCPRVSYEMLVPYRRKFQESFSMDETRVFRSNPAELVRRLEQGFGIWEDLPNLKGKGNPLGTFNLNMGDPESLHILFVAVCRSLGIPARLHPSEQKPQYLKDSNWVDAVFTMLPSEKKERTAWGTVQLLRDPEAAQDGPTASYYENFTFARLEDGVYKTLVYPYGKSDVYNVPFEVEPGSYRLVSGVRLKDGTVRLRFIYFTVLADQQTNVILTYRETAEDIPVLGTIDRSTNLMRADGSSCKLGELIGSKGAIVAWMEPEREPTKHLLRELRELSGEVDALGIPVVLVFGDPEWTASFSAEHVAGLPSRTIVVNDPAAVSLPHFISEASALEAGFPHLFALDREDQIRYTSSGYKIGIGKEAVQVLTGLLGAS